MPEVLLFTVDLQTRIRVAVGASGQLPQAILVKTKLPWSLEAALQLPFTYHTGAVTGIMQHIPDRAGIRGKQPELAIVPAVRHSRHDLHSGWGTDGLTEAILKSQSASGKLVEIRSLISLSAVGSDTFIAHIIGHDQNNIGGAISHRRMGCESTQEVNQ